MMNFRNISDLNNENVDVDVDSERDEIQYNSKQPFSLINTNKLPTLLLGNSNINHNSSSIFANGGSGSFVTNTPKTSSSSSIVSSSNRHSFLDMSSDDLIENDDYNDNEIKSSVAMSTTNLNNKDTVAALLDEIKQEKFIMANLNRRDESETTFDTEFLNAALNNVDGSNGGNNYDDLIGIQLEPVLLTTSFNKENAISFDSSASTLKKNAQTKLTNQNFKFQTNHLLVPDNDNEENSDDDEFDFNETNNPEVNDSERENEDDDEEEVFLDTLGGTKSNFLSWIKLTINILEENKQINTSQNQSILVFHF